MNMSWKAVKPEILRLHGEGYSVREIEERIGANAHGYVAKLIKQSGFEPIRKTKAERARDELIIQLAENNETLETICKESGTSKSYVYGILKDNNLAVETEYLRRSRLNKEKLIQMRTEKKTYAEIADALGTKLVNVQNMCSDLGLTYSDDEVKAYLIERSNASEIAEKLKAFNVGLEYVGGYIAKQKPMTVRKISCGHEFEMQWHSLTANKRDDVPCPICRQEKQNQRQAATKIRRESYTKNCTVCGKLMDGQLGSSRKYCSKECAIKAHTIRQTAELKAKFISETRTCKNCGKMFHTEFKGLKKYCSDACREAYERTIKREEWSKRHKGKLVDRGITLTKIYNRNNGVCQICGRKCDWNDFNRNASGHFIIGHSYPTIDHIKPLSKGGLHEWDNVQLACFMCNSVKSDTYQEVV